MVKIRHLVVLALVAMEVQTAFVASFGNVKRAKNKAGYGKAHHVLLYSLLLGFYRQNK